MSIKHPRVKHPGVKHPGALIPAMYKVVLTLWITGGAVERAYTLNVCV